MRTVWQSTLQQDHDESLNPDDGRSDNNGALLSEELELLDDALDELEHMNE